MNSEYSIIWNSYKKTKKKNDWLTQQKVGVEWGGGWPTHTNKLFICAFIHSFFHNFLSVTYAKWHLWKSLGVNLNLFLYSIHTSFTLLKCVLMWFLNLLMLQFRCSGVHNFLAVGSHWELCWEGNSGEEGQSGHKQCWHNWISICKRKEKKLQTASHITQSTENKL